MGHGTAAERKPRHQPWHGCNGQDIGRRVADQGGRQHHGAHQGAHDGRDRDREMRQLLLKRFNDLINVQ